MDYLLFPWYWLKSKFRHKCENWQQFLGNEKGGVIFCSVCAKIIDEKATRGE